MLTAGGGIDTEKGNRCSLSVFPNTYVETRHQRAKEAVKFEILVKRLERMRDTSQVCVCVCFCISCVCFCISVERISCYSHRFLSILSPSLSLSLILNVNLCARVPCILSPEP